jgi:hypothetical protein
VVRRKSTTRTTYRCGRIRARHGNVGDKPTCAGAL